jgi:hypothetical protein
MPTVGRPCSTRGRHAPCLLPPCRALASSSRGKPRPRHLHLITLPVSLLLSSEADDWVAAIAKSSAATMRARHRTTGHYTTPTAPPPPPEPHRPLLWSNRARVRAHCRLFPARSSPARCCPHGPPWPALLSALPSHLALVLPSPSRLDASVMTLPGNVFPSRRKTAAHRRAMAACGARTRSRSSTSPRSSIGVSLGLPWLWEADAHLR